MNDFEPGTLYGNYEPKFRLNNGTEAYIYKATNTITGEEAVLRLPYRNKKYSIDTDDLKRHFEREVQIYERLKGCPHIISLLESGWNNGKPYLVMPYIQGESLKDELKKLENRPLPFNKSLIYIQETAEALSYVHKAGFMHRDVCPRNLLLGSNGILLSDFGLAADEMDTSSETRPNWGSYPYVAPEQIGGNPCQASDQYALAVIMCELLTGKYPWDGTRGKEGGGAQDLETIFPKIAKVFTRASDTNSDNRYSSIEAFEGALDKAALLHLLEQSTLAGSNSLKNESSSQQRNDWEVHKPESLDKKDSSSPQVPYPSSNNQQTDNQKVKRIFFRRAFSWGKVTRLILILLLLAATTISIVDDVHSRLYPPAPSDINLKRAQACAPDLASASLQNYLSERKLVSFSNVPFTPNLPLATIPVTPNILTVTTLEDSLAGSLRQEIATAQKGNGATITFDSSLQGAVTLTQDLEIPADVSIEAPAAHQIIITPQNPTITLHIPQGNNVSFANIDFQGSNQVGTKASIVNEGTLHITNSLISQFQSSGGVFSNLNGGRLTFTDSEIAHNQSFENDGGAISNLNGTVTLDNTTIDDNRANYNGGGIYSLNGHVFIQNQSSIANNHVLYSPNGGDLGGGGGITIHGGSVSISDSSIEGNSSKGNGGGILLIGTNAQIDHSSIRYNQTDTNQAGGIAVETNPENGYCSFLVLTNNTLVRYNSNSNSPSSSDFAVNIEGKVVGKDSVNTSINSKPLEESSRSPSDPTTFNQFLGYLTLENFQRYCQSLQNSQRQPFTDASLSSDGQTVTCTSNNGETLSLSTKDNKINEVCSMLNPAAKLPLARLFRYTDSSTWQCFRDEHLLSAITKPNSSTNKVPLDSYCAGMGASAELVPEPNQPANAYDWQCRQGTRSLPLTMDVACQKVTQNPLALAKLGDHSDPYSWQCWGS